MPLTFIAVATLTVREFDRTIDGGMSPQVVLLGSITAVVATVIALAFIRPPK